MSPDVEAHNYVLEAMTRWNKHRALIGYLAMITLVFVLVQVRQVKNQNELRDTQRIACVNAKQITANQRLVLLNLLELRTAALSSPYLKLEAQHAIPYLRRALTTIDPPIIEAACR